MMKRFLVIVEEGDSNLSAYSPDLPGCIATGKTYDETLQNMYEAIEFHLEAMMEDGEPLPQSISMAAYLTLPEPAAPMVAMLA
ncbi:MAG TPA: type II toxin-antitoxin system HicB family antitoxin [Anaerolineae bacterium]|jgi:predicted RNase H-like HicB family nuclease|nr:type II toxin-antitoxin system HicB family antitoxin [Anaerolineae bacterium]